ncbi:Hpt domain-containing protein [Pelagicoccus sp. NFK12]|uniref:Hpt domain-containing protein n=1 Tax=Pelagicoccus enzymogenes TaxID=2773457 RepID=A0A927FC95_9BACT|nr:Hpt domain-containing protein [Pelagicoccus enzymogenes]MBD5780783.1 Hpt domain-containing protein [Pelagicoccus enzymogenes]MDQ8200461.1 Hpt domain-containing protein [Pelagicoccus enzymogenes]
MSDSELIDWEQLEMIFGEEEDEFDEDMAELFHEFVEDGNGQFGKIDAAEFSTDRAVIAKESHKLKGSASNFGFTQVANLLAHIEDDIETLTADDFVNSLEAARSGFAKSVETVMARYPALAAGAN